MTKKNKRPWPTKDAMVQVYEMSLWGGQKYKFYSGEGSHKPEIYKPFLERVISFLSSFSNPLNVCDLGCGDFHIGNQLVPYCGKYTAVDIVPTLIEHNKNTFKHDNLEFFCKNLAEDDLPKGDCAILRQVLQHLSNNEVKSIVDKLYQYKHLIITEHIPAHEFEPNHDIISGRGNRLKYKSGLDLLKAPFHLKVKSQKTLSEVFLGEKQGKIVTWLFEL